MASRLGQPDQLPQPVYLDLVWDRAWYASSPGWWGSCSQLHTDFASVGQIYAKVFCLIRVALSHCEEQGRPLSDILLFGQQRLRGDLLKAESL